MPRPSCAFAHTVGLGRNAVASSSRLTLRSRARYVHVVSMSSSRPLTSAAALAADVEKAANGSGSVPQPPAELSDTLKRAYVKLRPVVDGFNAPIDLAVAYGSGVVAQANASKDGPQPLTDFILSTPNARAFHAANMKQFPSHYPLYARLLGPRAVGWMQDRIGAGMWYVTMVHFGDMEVKYGIISTPLLSRDLENWTTLYVSGRLHKPVLTLHCVPSLEPALEANTHSALALALLQLPPAKPFTELALWEAIAGISYSGDPRMSMPGAENPDKVKNIVRGPGVLDGFRRLYGPHIGAAVGLRYAGEYAEKPSAAAQWSWHGAGEALLAQPSSEEHYATLLAALPLTLRRALARHFRPTIAGALVDKDVRAERRETRASQRAFGGPLWDDKAFWLGVAGKDGFREVVANEVRNIIRRPALTQSIKGLVTAGFSKSVVYSLAKFRKWWAGRAAKAAARAKAKGAKVKV